MTDPDGPFVPPHYVAHSDVHHEAAARQNDAVAAEASTELMAMLSGTSPMERVLLKAAAGAGKSYALKRMVTEAVAHPNCARVAVTAFQNKQIWDLAPALGKALGKDAVCLFTAADRWGDVPDGVFDAVEVATTATAIPATALVVVATVSKLGVTGELKRLTDHLGTGHTSTSPFDVLFVDEAWQVAHHLFDKITKVAPKWVGVGDVGQLPPLEIGQNPWRGDPGYNPYRAWPTDYDANPRTWVRELPAVWRPAARHLALWRAFYPEWKHLDCVADPGDRSVDLGTMDGPERVIWEQVGTGVPTLLEVDGLRDPEAADVDLPLMEFVEVLLDSFFEADPSLVRADYDADASGRPTGTTTVQHVGSAGDPLVTILATRNQAVDDAEDAVKRLHEKHNLTENDLVASTVDSWQGRTNGITIAVHPLNGADELDSFNSAFGRLAVACTRATHGLLMVTRPGLNGLLANTPARPGTPFGEPGSRQLPRQTHQRILAAFARGEIDVSDDEE
jgi:hypothetical protein